MKNQPREGRERVSKEKSLETGGAAWVKALGPVKSDVFEVTKENIIMPGV